MMANEQYIHGKGVCPSPIVIDGNEDFALSIDEIKVKKPYKVRKVK